MTAAHEEGATAPAAAARPRLEQVAVVAAPAFAAIALGRHGISADGVLGAGLAVVLVALAVIDVRQRRLPNAIVLPAVLTAVAIQAVFHPGRLPEVLVAAFASAAFFLVPTLVYRGGVGMGDVKLAFLIGLVLGGGVVPALLVATVAAAVYALVLLARRGRSARKETLAYGPFLAAGALLVILLGSPFPS
jgi:prepilin signal peptidase PulO-like enzyme (type II secretory pathway)